MNFKEIETKIVGNLNLDEPVDAAAYRFLCRWWGDVGINFIDDSTINETTLELVEILCKTVIDSYICGANEFRSEAQLPPKEIANHAPE